MKNKLYLLFWLWVPTQLFAQVGFDKTAGENQFMLEDYFVYHVNTACGIASTSYADFAFASSKAEYGKIYGNLEIKLENVVVYAKSEMRSVDYFIVRGRLDVIPDGYSFRTKEINGEVYTMLVSLKATAEVSDFLYESFTDLDGN